MCARISDGIRCARVLAGRAGELTHCDQRAASSSLPAWTRAHQAYPGAHGTARVSNRQTCETAACLRARYCTNLVWFDLERTTLWRTYDPGCVVRNYERYNRLGMAAVGRRHFRAPVKRLARPLVAHRRTVVSPGLVFRLCGGSCHVLGRSHGWRKHLLARRS